MRGLILVILAFALGAIIFYWNGYRLHPHWTVRIPDASGHPINVPGVFTWLPFREYSQLSLKNSSVEEATKAYVARCKRDHQYDWKVAIAFYGQVVDENGHPVPNADVRFEWNTNNVSGGTEMKLVGSNDHGLFSLNGEHGKILGVLVKKTGYYTHNRGAERNFEFADPSSPSWHEPDSRNPVVFRLRKKGPGVDLFSKHLTIPVYQKRLTQNQVDLVSGFIRPGALTIETDTSKFLPGGQPFPWRVNIKMSEGGLVETDEPFPFQAPSEGYSPSTDFTFADLDRNRWPSGFTKTFYFYMPSSNTYGRIRLEVSDSLPIELDEVYNLKAGDRYLEPRDTSWRDHSSQEQF